MKPIGTMTLLLVIFLSTWSCTPKQEYIVFFGADVTPAQRKAALDTLTAQGVELLEGESETEHYFLMKSDKGNPCKDQRLRCEDFPNTNARTREPCEHCVICCPKGTHQINPLSRPSEATTLFKVMTRIEIARVSDVPVTGEKEPQKPKVIAVNIDVSDNTKQAGALMKLEEKLLARDSIDLEARVNNAFVVPPKKR